MSAAIEEARRAFDALMADWLEARVQVLRFNHNRSGEPDNADEFAPFADRQHERAREVLATPAPSMVHLFGKFEVAEWWAKEEDAVATAEILGALKADLLRLGR